MEDRLAPILRALPCALRGASTDVLAFDGLDQLVLPAGLPASVASALGVVLEPCLLYRALDGLLRRVAPRGLLAQALWSSVRDALRAYLALVGELEASIAANDAKAQHSQEGEARARSAGVPLARLQVALQSPTLCLRLFLAVVKRALQPGTNVLSVLYEYAQHGDPLVQAYAADLHAACLKPFARLRMEWEDFGSLSQDVYGEFFVRPATPGAAGRSASKECEFELVQSRVPPPLTREDAQRSLERGRTVHFIREICGDSAFDGAGRSTLDILRHAHRLLTVDHELLVHFRGLRDYMLLADGNFMDALFRTDSTKFLRQPVSEVSSYMASEFFVSAIEDLGVGRGGAGGDSETTMRCVDAYILGLDSGDSGDDPAPGTAAAGAGGGSVGGASASSVSLPTSVSASTSASASTTTVGSTGAGGGGSGNGGASSSSSKGAKPRRQWRVWEAFIGKYHLDARPLKLTVDQRAVATYERCFASFWRVRLAVHSLIESSSLLRWLTRKRDAAALIETHHIMNAEMLRVQQFLYYNVLAQEWAEFEAQLLKTPLTLTQIKAAHDSYLARIADAAASSARSRAIQGLAKIVLGFQRELEDIEAGAPEPSAAELADLVATFSELAASLKYRF